MQRFYKPLAVFLLLALGGCGITGNIKPGEGAQLDDRSAVLFLGVTPAYRIHLLRGRVENDVWDRPTVDIPEINITPESGYIFVKVKATTPGERLGVSLIFREGRGYGPCQDSIAPIFTLKPGTVSYVGDLHYSFSDNRLRYDYTVEEDKAREFLRKNYPTIRTAMTTVPMVPMRVKSTLCDSKTITIPIYIPRGR
jgi:hypothetical protein